MDINQFLESIPKSFRPYFTRAYNAAVLGDGVGRSYVRHGAVLVDNKTIVSTGFNCRKTHPYLSKVTTFPFFHAESHAILRQGFETTPGMSLFVLRIRKTGHIGLSAPCNICKAIIKMAGIKETWYSTELNMERL